MAESFSRVMCLADVHVNVNNAGPHTASFDPSTDAMLGNS